MSEESKIISSFSLQETLNPKIWNNYTNPEKASLKPEIRKKLLEIAHEFMDFIDVEFFVDDIIFTGSLSNFNWSDFSDVDLHLEVDFTQFDKDSVELYRELFNLKKLLFNTNHDITIKGFEAELYVQDIIEPHTSGGIYSVLYDEWTVVPEKKDVKIDKNLLKTKIKTWTKKIDEVTEQVQNGDYDESIALVKELRDKIKKYRKAGLEEKGEFSYENLVFKYLRRGKYIERLIDLSNKLKDKKLSLESLNESLINEQSLFDKILSFLGFGKDVTSSEKKFIEKLEALIKSNKELKWEKGKKIQYDSDVEILQTSLQLLGFSLPQWDIDGKFGPETNKSVINFQKEHNLIPNGVVNNNTLRIILKELSKIDLSDEKINRVQKQRKINSSDNKNKILKFLTDKGLTIEQASGIVGNLQAESNFNPEAIGDNNTSLGIAQWHQDRKENLIEFCNTKNQTPKSLDCQLNFLWYELNTKYSNVLSSIKNSKTTEESAEIFASRYEKPRSTDYSKRINFAEKIYNDALIS